MSFSVDDFRLDTQSQTGTKPKGNSRKQTSRDELRLGFLKGPIPADWLKVAGSLPGKTLHIGIAIWLVRGVEKRKRFKFTPRWYSWFSLDPHTVRRALLRLQQAGLIRVERKPGCSPIVTVLEAPKEDESLTPITRPPAPN
jgi:hypothetical protein